MNRIQSDWLEEREDAYLDAAIEATVTQPIDELAVERVKLRARTLVVHESISTPVQVLAIPSDSAKAIQPSSSRMRLTPIKLLTGLAASIAILVWWTMSSSPIAMAKIAESISAIRSVRFHFSTSYGGQEPSDGTIEIQDQVIRYDHGSRVHIYDHANQKAAVLETQDKLWQELDLSGLPQPVINPLVELVAARGRAAKPLGHEWRDGKKLSIYELENFDLMASPGKGKITLWLNDETNLPVRIEWRDPDPKFKKLTIFDQFKWELDLPADHFAIRMPEGYQPGEIEPQSTKMPTKTQLVEKQDLSSGLVYSGRVPGCFEVDRERKLLTAILRDKEGSHSGMPTQLRQWDLSTGQIRWTKFVGGAIQFGLRAEHNLLALIEGQEIQIREATTGEVIRTMETEHVLGAVAIDMTGSRMASAYIDWGRNQSKPVGGVELWNISTGALERSIDVGDRVEMAAIRPDGAVIAAASQGNIRFYNTETGRLEHALLGTSRIDYSADGRKLAFISIEQGWTGTLGKVHVLDAMSYANEQSLTLLGGKERTWPLGLDFSPSGKRVAACDWNGAIGVWDLANGQAVSGLKPMDSGVHCIRFIDENHIATGSEDGTLRIHRLGD